MAFLYVASVPFVLVTKYVLVLWLILVLSLSPIDTWGSCTLHKLSTPCKLQPGIHDDHPRATSCVEISTLAAHTSWLPSTIATIDRVSHHCRVTTGPQTSMPEEAEWKRGRVVQNVLAT